MTDDIKLTAQLLRGCGWCHRCVACVTRDAQAAAEIARLQKVIYAFDEVATAYRLGRSPLVGSLDTIREWRKTQ